MRLRTCTRRVRTQNPNADIGDGLYVVIEVEDQGPGIPEADRDRIFEPFFTTKSTDAHIGLGLALVRTVVEHAGGGLEVESKPRRADDDTGVLSRP